MGKLYDVNGVLTTRNPALSQTRHQAAKRKSNISRINAILGNSTIKVCIYRTIGGLGDFLLATPIARAAKTKYPGCEVTFAIPINYGGGDGTRILENNPYIDHIVDYKTVDKKQYHVVSDISFAAIKDEKPGTEFPSRMELFAQYGGFPLYNQYIPIYSLTEKEEDYGKTFLKKNSPKLKGGRGKKKTTFKSIIAIQLAASEPKRSWPRDQIEQFIQLAQKEDILCVLFGWGSDAENWTEQFSNLICVFNFNIRAAAAILNQCNLLVCPDSVLLHLGAALNIPTLCLLGSQPPRARVGRYPNAVAVLNKDIPCLGCVWSSCQYDRLCMKSIYPSSILQISQRILDKGIPENTLTITIEKQEKGEEEVPILTL